MTPRITIKYRGLQYKFETERDGDGFNRYTTLVWVNDKWVCAVPCSLDTDGPRWEKEMDIFIEKFIAAAYEKVCKLELEMAKMEAKIEMAREEWEKLLSSVKQICAAGKTPPIGG